MIENTPNKKNSDKDAEQYDVVIVGAGISGICSAHALRQAFPEKQFLILESLETFGGTWHIHNYPGTRSDSDLFTFGYGFKPWIGNPIATRQQILDYLGSVIADANLAPHIRYKHRVRSADWSSASNTWSLEVESAGGQRRMNIQTNFLWMCQGYYRHSHGYTPAWPGMDRFKGQVIHPQNWPEDLDLTDKRVTVIGSGATAATLIPAMAGQCAHVTMLQRTPTYFATGRNSDALAEELRSLGIDETWIHEIMRRKVVRERADIIEKAKSHPDVMKKHLIAGVKACLPEGFDVDKHFTPPYRPFQQRVAFVPDGDLFKAFSSGQASVVTDHIEHFDDKGIQLKSGERVDCDVVVTATGFELSVMGEIPFSVDGQSVNFAKTVSYRGIMFTGVPNMAWVYGYGRYSWTLRAELIAQFVCKLLHHMQEHHLASVKPSIRAEDTDMQLLPWTDLQDMNAGYVLRGVDRMPKRGSKPEWQHSQDYLYESEVLPNVDFSDEIFVYTAAAQHAQHA
jgi:cation diffusion facilitator CzcD-associated flavoprotein CzcO